MESKRVSWRYGKRNKLEEQVYDLKKEECVFFDDTKENVDASNTFGIHAFVYQNAKDAMHAIQSLDAEK